MFQEQLVTLVLYENKYKVNIPVFVVINFVIKPIQQDRWSWKVCSTGPRAQGTRTLDMPFGVLLRVGNAHVPPPDW